MAQVILWLCGGAVPSRATLREYKYIAPPLSLLERLFLDRFWSLLPGRVYPKWLAPNLITSLGLLSIVLGFACVAVTSPEMRGDGGCYGLLGFFIFAYQTLDGSDGKQARFTGTGSALGEVFDHGVDALTTVLITTSCLDMAGLGVESPLNWLCVLLASCAFYLSNLSLVHTGVQQFHNIDIQELLVALQVVCFARAFLGSMNQGNVVVVVGAVVGMTLNCGQLLAALPAAPGLKRQLGSLLGFALAMVLNIYTLTSTETPRFVLVPLTVTAACAFGDLARRALLQRVAHLEAIQQPMAPTTIILAALAFVDSPVGRTLAMLLALAAYSVAAKRTVDATAMALGIHPFSTQKRQPDDNNNDNDKDDDDDDGNRR